MQRLVDARWPGNVRQLRNLIESMVVLAPGTEIRASDIPPDIVEGAPTVLPVLAAGAAWGGGPDSQQLQFILRSIMDLRRQVEDLKSRLGEGDSSYPSTHPHPHPHPHPASPVRVIEVPETFVPLGEVEEEKEPEIVYRKGMTMAEIERAAIDAALRENGGNRRQAAQTLGIGERTLYRKIKEYGLD